MFQLLFIKNGISIETLHGNVLNKSNTSEKIVFKVEAI